MALERLSCHKDFKLTQAQAKVSFFHLNPLLQVKFRALFGLLRKLRPENKDPKTKTRKRRPENEDPVIFFIFAPLFIFVIKDRLYSRT